MQDEFPVIDCESTEAPAEVTSRLHEIGFAALANHPIDDELVEAVHFEWEGFLSSTAKAKYPFTPRQDGYYGPEISETAKGGHARDLKEFFQYYPWGQYPTEVSNGARRLFDQAQALAVQLLSWVQSNTPDEVAKRFSMPLPQMVEGGHRTMLRILRYPPLEAGHGDSVRAAPHEDINLLTVLVSSTEPGLEVFDPRVERWLVVPAVPGIAVVNSGDMLKLASGGWFASATHRVTNPTGERSSRVRMSTPLFVQPADEVLLAPDRTARGFLAERIREIRGVDIT